MTLKEYKSQPMHLFVKMEEEHDVRDIHMYRNGDVVCRIEIS